MCWYVLVRVILFQIRALSIVNTYGYQLLLIVQKLKSKVILLEKHPQFLNLG